MPKLQVIVGTTRPIRAADRVVPWVVERAKAHGVFEVQVLDLRDWRLPFFQEHRGTIGDFSNPDVLGPRSARLEPQGGRGRRVSDRLGRVQPQRPG
jgi:hypothetical protein